MLRCMFFSPSAELCGENFKPQPKYVKKCAQSGAVRGMLHNLGCLSIAPHAEEELSWAENERHKHGIRGNAVPSWYAQFPCEGTSTTT